MSRFCLEDLVSLRDDPSILATIQCTRTEGEASSSDFYYHESLSVDVRRLWSRHKQLQPGYLILDFVNEHDGSCLVSEDSIQLVDRPFAIGDIVKRNISDAQSGVVVSTSVKCSIQSCFSQRAYEKPDRALVETVTAPNTEVCASKLKAAAQWREEDHVVYQDWVGQIESVNETVTLRLADGGIVVVKDSDALRAPHFEKGAAGLCFSRRLQNIGYCPTKDRKRVIDHGSVAIEGILHPGMLVRTQKIILKNGQWKRGAYNPNLKPYGMVVDVQCVSMDIVWQCPNILQKSASAQQPPQHLNQEQVESGRLQPYDRNKIGSASLSHQLSGAVYTPDFDVGLAVVFRSRGPQDGIDNGDPLYVDPKQTGGHDMNTYQVVRISTMTKVLWQDGASTSEQAFNLSSYEDPDEHDLWPGDLVSFGPGEYIKLDKSVPFSRSHRIGIVQSVNAKLRMARVRWYEDPVSELDTTEDFLMNYLGAIGDVFEQVSLYDLNNASPFYQSRGNLVLILPDMPYLVHTDLPWSLQQTLHSFSEEIRQTIWYAISRVASYFSLTANTLCHSEFEESRLPSIFDTSVIFGEVVDLCLDGSAIVRLGLTTESREVKVSQDRIVHIPESEGNDNPSAEDETDSLSTISIGESDDASTMSFVTADFDLGESLSDDPDVTGLCFDEQKSPEIEVPNALPDLHQGQLDNQFTSQDAQPLHLQPIKDTIPKPPDMDKSDALSCFSVLETMVPLDHKYLDRAEPLAKEQLRRIALEHRILASSLPDNVYVRGWESRLDLLRILLVGPEDTPYQRTPFVFDLYLSATFPATPPLVHFHSWTNRGGPVNPNLYQDGKVCLSLLGTWRPQSHREGWTANSTILQVIVSILGLVLVREPYFNEPGLESLKGTPASVVPSAMYSERAYILSKRFVKTALMSPPGSVEDIIKWLYVSSDGPKLLTAIVRECSQLQSITGDEDLSVEQTGSGCEVDWAAGRLSAGAMLSLKSDLDWLVKYAEQHASNTDVVMGEAD